MHCSREGWVHTCNGVFCHLEVSNTRAFYLGHIIARHRLDYTNGSYIHYTPLSLNHPSLPGALGMIGLAMGVSRISATLPGPVYPLLSGLNAATVGIIAYAGVQLSRKAITGPLTRLLVIGSGCAGICYTALWYFPVILIIDGVITLSWALWYGSAARIEIIERCRRCLYGDAVVSRGPEESAQESGLPATIPMQGSKVASGNSPHRSSRLVAPTRISLEHVHCVTTNSIESFGIGDQGADLQASPQSPILPTMSVKASIALVVAFFGE